MPKIDVNGNEREFNETEHKSLAEQIANIATQEITGPKKLEIKQNILDFIEGKDKENNLKSSLRTFVSDENGKIFEAISDFQEGSIKKNSIADSALKGLDKLKQMAKTIGREALNDATNIPGSKQTKKAQLQQHGI